MLLHLDPIIRPPDNKSKSLAGHISWPDNRISWVPLSGPKRPDNGSDLLSGQTRQIRYPDVFGRLQIRYPTIINIGRIAKLAGK